MVQTEVQGKEPKEAPAEIVVQRLLNDTKALCSIKMLVINLFFHVSKSYLYPTIKAILSKIERLKSIYKCFHILGFLEREEKGQNKTEETRSKDPSALTFLDIFLFLHHLLFSLTASLLSSKRKSIAARPFLLSPSLLLSIFAIFFFLL